MIKILSENQKRWLKFNQFSVGGVYSMPKYGIAIYSKPSVMGVHEYLYLGMAESCAYKIEEIGEEFIKITPLHIENPEYTYYLAKRDIELRDGAERIFLTIVCLIPMLVKNLFTRKC